MPTRAFCPASLRWKGRQSASDETPLRPHDRS